jgi:hypothetical protein
MRSPEYCLGYRAFCNAKDGKTLNPFEANTRHAQDFDDGVSDAITDRLHNMNAQSGGAR